MESTLIPGKVIHSEPLSGLLSIQPKLRIVVWDHHEDKAVFVGPILFVREHELTGENYVHNSAIDGKFSKRTTLKLQDIGLVPIKDGKPEDSYSPRFRTYALSGELGFMDYQSYKVDYKIKDQQTKQAEHKRQEKLKRRQARS